MQGLINQNGRTMYAKIFSQIFDSSIAENYEVRHVFEDLLKLADKTGAVDMTVEAVARRTNVPLGKVKSGIEELMRPDKNSRTKEHEGRRLVLLDDRRNWGWMIVNYERYRALQDEEARREAWRNAKAKQRRKDEPKNNGKKKNKNKGLPLVLEAAHERADRDGWTQDQKDRMDEGLE